MLRGGGYWLNLPHTGGMVIDLLLFSWAVLLLLLLSRAVLHLSHLSRRWSVSQFIGIVLAPGVRGSQHRHLLPREPAGFGVAAPALHRACRGGSASGTKWCRTSWLGRLGAVASPEPELLPLLPSGSVSLAVAAVAAREGDPHEGANGRDLGSRSPFEQDCLGPLILTAALGDGLRNGGNLQSRLPAVHN